VLVELFIISKALKAVTNGNGNGNGRSWFSPPSSSTPPSSTIAVPLREVSKFKELGLLVPMEARNGQKVTPKPITITIPKVLDLSGIDFTPKDTPSQIANRLKYGSGL
jgi:hypothetical protein